MPYPQRLIAQLIQKNPNATDDEILAMAQAASGTAQTPVGAATPPPQGQPIPPAGQTPPGGTWDLAGVMQRHAAQGGTTTNLSRGDLAGQPFFAVAAYPDRQQVVRALDENALKAYMARNEDLLADDLNSLGTWVDDEDGSPTQGSVYLDITRTLPDRVAAETLGREKKQKAIFDLGAMDTISLGSNKRQTP
jgi:hypothetical protein